MKATIVSIGTELLFGQIVNTNAAWLSSELQVAGVDVLYHFTVGDNPERVRAILKRALDESDLVITTGGLGPTQDDLTKEIIAEVIDVPLIQDEKTIQELEAFFLRRGAPMTENNRKQALMPENAQVFYNPVGTAPGFLSEVGEKTIMALPGPPREMKALFDLWVRPWLNEKTQATIFYKILRFYGIGESALETKLLPIIEGQTDPTIATYAKDGECTVRVASKRAREEDAIYAVAETIEKIRELVGEYLYSTENMELHEVVAQKLIARSVTLSTAESCTGGMFADRLLSVPGMSASFLSGWIVYSNESKTELLGVSKELIEKKGSVSEDVAIAMATGARTRAQSDIAISVTGVAGPDGGSESKPIGGCWIAVASKGKISTFYFEARNLGRAYNRSVFTLAMLDVLNKTLDNKL
ncbi:MAG: competence/damage-inducible protein A [Clostridiales Family XIII bacterium]|jgi:nicotinamide-nucleotide amidase|nr:competence/damage-inducible protein A [Clostridiales Family XIII bacterium]